MFLDSIREDLGRRIIATGAAAWGYAPAEKVPQGVSDSYNAWLKAGFNAGMEYMERYMEVRDDPHLLLEGAQSVISIAYSYRQTEYKAALAAYAYGLDYHDVLREKLREIADFLTKEYGAQSRICIDSAPIHERYWGVRCGLGSLCANGALYVPGIGSDVFLAEIITTLPCEDTSAARINNIDSTPKRGNSIGKGSGGSDNSVSKPMCTDCGKCKSVCPGNAILCGGHIDARKCVNYLTIEHRGEWNEEQKKVMEESGPTIMGCDRCLRVCPLNHGAAPAILPEFRLRDNLRTITKADIATMSQADFSRLFKGSPVKRAKLAGVRRNLGLCQEAKDT